MQRRELLKLLIAYKLQKEAGLLAAAKRVAAAFRGPTARTTIRKARTGRIAIPKALRTRVREGKLVRSL